MRNEENIGWGSQFDSIFRQSYSKKVRPIKDTKKDNFGCLLKGKMSSKRK